MFACFAQAVATSALLAATSAFTFGYFAQSVATSALTLYQFVIGNSGFVIRNWYKAIKFSAFSEKSTISRMTTISTIVHYRVIRKLENEY